MNRTKIEWTDYSWNPVTGCLHGCWYCYANKLSKRFKKIFPNGFNPTFYPERLKEPWDLKKPSKIFVCSIADLFARWTRQEWRDKVIDSALNCPVPHSFQFLTKNPEWIPYWFQYSDNFWVGATVSTQEECWRIDRIRKVKSGVRFISFEPLLGPIKPDLKDIQWIIIGKLTGSKRVKLSWSWVESIVDEALFQGIPVFEKNNLGLEHPVQDFPEV